MIGPRFDMTVLKAVTPDPARSKRISNSCATSRSSRRSPERVRSSSQCYRFTQTLLQDVIYQNLLLQRRTEMHGFIGAALERLTGRDPDLLEDLVRSAIISASARRRRKGARYLAAAGDRARRSTPTTMRFSSTSRRSPLLSNGPDMRGQLALASALPICADRPAGATSAREHYETVLAALRTAGDGAGAARILRKIGRLLWDAGQAPGAEASYARRRPARRADRARRAAHLLQERGRLAFRMGDHAAAATLGGGRASPYAGPQPLMADQKYGSKQRAPLPRRSIPRVLRWHGSDAAGSGPRGRTECHCCRLSRPARRCLPRLHQSCRTLHHIDPAQAMEVCRRGPGGRASHRRPWVPGSPSGQPCGRMLHLHRPLRGEGMLAAEKAIELDRALDQREHLPVPLIVLGQIHQCHGKPELAARYYKDALARGPEKQANHRCCFHAMMGLPR